MSTPDRPNEPMLSPWKGRARGLEIRERWRVFCDAQACRLNAPDSARPATRDAAGAVSAVVVPPVDGVVAVAPGVPGAATGRDCDAQR